MGHKQFKPEFKVGDYMMRGQVVLVNPVYTFTYNGIWNRYTFEKCIYIIKTPENKIITYEQFPNIKELFRT